MGGAITSTTFGEPDFRMYNSECPIIHSKNSAVIKYNL